MVKLSLNLGDAYSLVTNTFCTKQRLIIFSICGISNAKDFIGTSGKGEMCKTLTSEKKEYYLLSFLHLKKTALPRSLNVVFPAGLFLVEQKAHGFSIFIAVYIQSFISSN